MWGNSAQAASHSPAAPTPAVLLCLGDDRGGSGAYNLTGGSLNGGGEYSGYAGTGTFTQSGGTNNAGYYLTLAIASSSAGTFNLDGGILITSALRSGSGSATFNFGGGTLQAGASFPSTVPMTLTGVGGNATIDTAGNTLTLSGSLSGPGGLTKTDSGTLVLAAANTYTGPTSVNGGVLSLTGSLSAATSLAVGGGTFSYAPTANATRRQ